MATIIELRGLLADILGSQPDKPEHWRAARAAGLADEQRLRAAVSGQQPLDEAERRLLLRSPQARERVLEVAATLRDEARAAWRQAGIAPVLVYQAAAGEQGGEFEPLSVDSNRDFSVSLLPLDPDGQRWTVSLRLSRRVLKTWSGPVRLMDSAGGQWLQGQPDGDGELSADWSLPGSPLERLRQFSLSIEPL